MTRIQKETVLSALAVYKDKCIRQEKRERSKGELGKAAKSVGEISKTNSLLIIFAQLLTEPCGSVKI